MKNVSPTKNKGHRLSVKIREFSALNKFTEAKASASEKNKCITKTLASSCWDF